jgi:hypothetical protein
MNYRFTLLILLFLIPSFVFSQKIGNVWYFGDRCGITFNTADGKPKVITDNILEMWEGCATVSNNSGDIDFYTDGINVITKNHDWMKINFAYRKYVLNGCSSSSQSAIIIPFPEDSLKYYIFTTECFENNATSRGINYSVVDMTRDNGYGNIFPFNVNIAPSSLEKLTATKHSNGKDYWVIAHAYDSDKFYAFLVDSAGVHTPVESNVPPAIGHNGIYGDQGYMKITSDGRKIAAAYTQYKTVYLYDFDNKTGRVGNPQPIYEPDKGEEFYGIEFSPDGTKLYASFYGFDRGIFQYDLSSGDINQIRRSEVRILDARGFPPAAMQLGPDGKIYVAKDVSPYLHIIHKPNKKFPQCDLETEAIFLDVDNAGRRCHLGLPNAMTSIFFVNVKATATVPACENDTVTLSAVVDASAEGYTVTWTGPNGFRSFAKDTSLIRVRLNASGWYYVDVNLNDKTARDSVYVEVMPSPEGFILPADTLYLCEGDYVLLTAMPEGLSYSWSTGEKTQNITVSDSGMYRVIIENENFCSDTAYCYVGFYPQPVAEIIGNTIICAGDSTLLTLTNKFSEYFWSTGDTTEAIYAKEEGWVSVLVIDENGCSAVDSIYITYYTIDLDYSDISSIDFGRVFIDSDSTLSVFIVNNDQTPVVIDDISFKNNNVFSHNQTLPATIASGMAYRIDITFSPDDILVFRDSIFVDVASPCPMRLVGSITGRGIVKLLVVLPDTTGEIANENYCIPVYGHFLTSRNITKSIQWQTKIAFDATNFLPQEIAAPISNGKRIITMVDDEEITRTVRVIGRFCGTIMLGDDDYTPLEFLYFDYDNPNVIVETIDGSLSVSGLCARDMSRLLALESPSLQVVPMPASDNLNVDFKIIRSGAVSLKIRNMQGVVSKNLLSSEVKAGRYSREFDISDLPQGVYFLIMTANGQIINKKIMIIR